MIHSFSFFDIYNFFGVRFSVVWFSMRGNAMLPAVPGHLDSWSVQWVQHFLCRLHSFEPCFPVFTCSSALAICCYAYITCIHAETTASHAQTTSCHCKPCVAMYRPQVATNRPTGAHVATGGPQIVACRIQVATCFDIRCISLVVTQPPVEHKKPHADHLYCLRTTESRACGPRAYMYADFAIHINTTNCRARTNCSQKQTTLL